MHTLDHAPIFSLAYPHEYTFAQGRRTPATQAHRESASRLDIRSRAVHLVRES